MADPSKSTFLKTLYLFYFFYFIKEKNFKISRVVNSSKQARREGYPPAVKADDLGPWFSFRSESNVKGRAKSSFTLQGSKSGLAITGEISCDIQFELISTQPISEKAQYRQS